LALSITTDYVKDTGDPSPFLRRIAEAGFSHVHWCHHWNTDFLYSRWEVDQIRRWLKEFGLALLDLHASTGPEKNWASPREHERQAGVELVRNRVEMAARLGSDVIIMHIPDEPGSESLRRSLAELAPVCRDRGVRIAIENGVFEAVAPLLAEHGADLVGLCYDSGHGNMAGDGLDWLERLRDRLISIHLHDNDGRVDQHNPLFSGTVDWQRLARLLAGSAYEKCVSMEVLIHGSGFDDEGAFLRHAFETGMRFSEMVEEARKALAAGGNAR
jgi:sugar phosphate isomerase/epimerase